VYTTGNAPPNDTDNVRITISAQQPPRVRLLNEDSIATYNLGTDTDGNLKGIPKTIIEDDITSNEDAEVRSKNLIDTYGLPFLSTTVILLPSVDKANNYKLGELIPVTDSDYGITEQLFTITKIVREFPGAGATITLGDEAYRLGQIETEIENRVNRLENRLSGDYDVFIDFRSSWREMTLLAKSFQVKTNSVAGENLIWDHAIYGIWDEQKWAPDSTPSTGGFILGHSIYGVLGSSKLGAGTDNEIIIDSGDYE